MKEIEGIHNAIVDQHKNDSRSSLSKLLRKVRNDLKKYENVNKKALEQLQGIADKEDLEERLASLRSSRNKITDLIATLDEKRAEQIDYTFKQMKKNFSSIFEKIVPEGQGELVLNIPEGQSDDDDDSQSEQSESLRSLNATELQILVSFTGTGMMKNMSQLSGGQKSVVAMVFILSLQHCDPAPFYLFDEVDAALDVQYRSSVAAVIQEQASSAQFIATTFRGELLEKAEKFFGVLFRGNSSHIKEVNREEAQDFVIDDNIQN